MLTLKYKNNILLKKTFSKTAHISYSTQAFKQTKTTLEFCSYCCTRIQTHAPIAMFIHLKSLNCVIMTLFSINDSDSDIVLYALWDNQLVRNENPAGLLGRHLITEEFLKTNKNLRAI